MKTGDEALAMVMEAREGHPSLAARLSVIESVMTQLQEAVANLEEEVHALRNQREGKLI